MMKTLFAAVLACLVVPALAQEVKTEQDKIFYAVGLSLSQQLASLSLTPSELEMVKRGMTDALTGKKPAVELQEYAAKVQEMAQTRRKDASEKMVAAGKEYLDKAAKEKGAVKTDSGMVYFSLKEGSGEHPKAQDTVKVNYRGTLTDGREFDSSAKHGGPAEFQLDRVVKCWTEGVQLMKPGGKARLVCPPSLAYGDRAVGGIIPANATLVFEVELVDIVKK
jgi:FKBP-type peptidyl-prolyl cis-trans isomerase FkpA